MQVYSILWNHADSHSQNIFTNGNTLLNLRRQGPCSQWIAKDRGRGVQQDEYKSINAHMYEGDNSFIKENGLYEFFVQNHST